MRGTANMIKSCKKILMVSLVCLLFITCANSYDLFLDVNVWGLCTMIKICQDSRRVIWRKNFLTSELLTSAQPKDTPQILSYLRTVRYKRIKNKVAKSKIKKYIRIIRRNKNQLSEDSVFRLNSLVFITALQNI